MIEGATPTPSEPASEGNPSPQSLVDLAGTNHGNNDSGEVQGKADPSAVQVPATPATQQPPTDWHWGEGVKGNGNKPEWLQERYKSVADQAQAYSELERKFGEFKGAPKDGYNFESIEGLNKDDPLLKHFSQTFKDLNLSQAGFERLTNEFIQLQLQGSQAQMEGELKKLGPGAKQTIGQVAGWINNMFTPDIAKTMQGWLQTADDVQAVQALIAMQPKTNVPSTEGYGATGPTYESKQEVLNEKTANWQRFKDDENYRAALTKRLHDAVHREDKLKKR